MFYTNALCAFVLFEISGKSPIRGGLLPHGLLEDDRSNMSASTDLVWVCKIHDTISTHFYGETLVLPPPAYVPHSALGLLFLSPVCLPPILPL